jgi:RNA 3'-terminal phosphate cyclase (ATP)
MLASQELDFIPAAPVSAGDYIFDVALAREGGSAGAVSLVAQLLSFETVGDTARACAR